jgi:carboxyl-terminal processing protease
MALVATSFVGGYLLGFRRHQQLQESTSFLQKNSSKLDLINEVYTEIKHAYVEKVSTSKLVKGAIDGMIKSLDDPYTRRLTGEHFKSFEEETKGKFSGVGIRIGMQDKKITIIAPIKDTPAERAGAKAGDVILKIDKQSTKNMPLSKAVSLIRGKPGTKVVLTVRRGDNKIVKLRITRAEIKVPNVTSKFLKGKLVKSKIGYINVHEFSSSTGDDVASELKKLEGKGAKGVILDLRNNPGGLLSEAVSLARVFIDSGPIVKIKSRSGKIKTILATGGAETKIPLVVLVNHGSASASEIVAGAVQDTGRGILVGEKTFGKGSVQSIVSLSDGSGLVITTAKYLTPKGRSLDRKGIVPDVISKLSSKSKEKYHIFLLGKNDLQLNKAEQVMEDLIAGKKIKKAS